MKSFVVLVDYDLNDGLTFCDVTGKSDTEIENDFEVRNCFVVNAATTAEAKEVFARCRDAWDGLKGPSPSCPKQGRVWGRVKLYDAAL